MEKPTQQFLYKITKKHKFYIRSKDGSLRSLVKISRSLYDAIIHLFEKGDANTQYQKLNTGVKHWNDYKPVKIFVPEEMKDEFKKLQDIVDKKRNPKSIVISYNGSWQSLVEFYI